MKKDTTQYVFDVEFKSCKDDGTWVSRSTRMVCPTGVDPRVRAATFAAEKLDLGETGVRVTFLGVRSGPRATEITEMNPFTVTIERGIKPHREITDILKRLAEKVERANNIRHSGGRITACDLAELFQLTSEAKKYV